MKWGGLREPVPPRAPHAAPLFDWASVVRIDR